jgi:hypothetical protein
VSDATTTNLGSARLKSLLVSSPSGLDDAVLELARSLGPDVAGDVVVDLIAAEVSRPTADGRAVRAAHLARELGLTRAIPPLVRCLERLDPDHPLLHAALTVLGGFGPAAVDPLLAAFHRCRDVGACIRIAEALSCADSDDTRIRGALVGMLERDPTTAARFLAERGEWRAVSDLHRAFDALAERPTADCDICAVGDLTAIASAVCALGGTLSAEQRTKIDEGWERTDGMWTRFDDSLDENPPARAPVVRTPRPGRNDPCPCGSGKKFKHCCVDADRQGARH